jgi:transposase
MIAEPRGRRVRRLHDIPTFGAPVRWRQRRYRCTEPACPVRGFTEDHALAGARLTTRAAWWAISCIQRDNASVASAARRLGVDWHTVWTANKPLLAELADDPNRLTGVDTLAQIAGITWTRARNAARRRRAQVPLASGSAHRVGPRGKSAGR